MTAPVRAGGSGSGWRSVQPEPSHTHVPPSTGGTWPSGEAEPPKSSTWWRASSVTMAAPVRGGGQPAGARSTHGVGGRAPCGAAAASPSSQAEPVQRQVSPAGVTSSRLPSFGSVAAGPAAGGETGGACGLQVAPSQVQVTRAAQPRVGSGSGEKRSRWPSAAPSAGWSAAGGDAAGCSGVQDWPSQLQVAPAWLAGQERPVTSSTRRVAGSAAITAAQEGGAAAVWRRAQSCPSQLQVDTGDAAEASGTTSRVRCAAGSSAISAAALGGGAV